MHKNYNSKVQFQASFLSKNDHLFCIQPEGIRVSGAWLTGSIQEIRRTINQVSNDILRRNHFLYLDDILRQIEQAKSHQRNINVEDEKTQIRLICASPLMLSQIKFPSDNVTLAFAKSMHRQTKNRMEKLSMLLQKTPYILNNNPKTTAYMATHFPEYVVRCSPEIKRTHISHQKKLTIGAAIVHKKPENIVYLKQKKRTHPLTLGARCYLINNGIEEPEPTENPIN